jgi:hypothetical protein
MPLDVYMGRGVASVKGLLSRKAHNVVVKWWYNEKPAGQIALACGFTRGGGGGNRTRVLQRRPKTSPGAVC